MGAKSARQMRVYSAALTPRTVRMPSIRYSLERSSEFTGSYSSTIFWSPSTPTI